MYLEICLVTGISFKTFVLTMILKICHLTNWQQKLKNNERVCAKGKQLMSNTLHLNNKPFQGKNNPLLFTKTILSMHGACLLLVYCNCVVMLCCSFIYMGSLDVRTQ